MNNETVRIRESVILVKETEDIYQVVFTVGRKTSRFKVDDLIKTIISMSMVEKPLDNLIDELSFQYPIENIKSAIASLRNLGILRLRDSILDNVKPQRQVYFIDEFTSSWDETLKLEQKIEGSTISVFGIGGIGTWIVNGLYQMGIGEIRIVDPDKVELSNINRQLFFTPSDVGKYKVDVISEKLPDAKIKKFKRIVEEDETLDDIIEGSDFLVNCADNPSVEDTTKIIARYATKFDLPYCVSGGYNLHLGIIGPVIVPGKTKNFQDFIEYQRKNDPLKDSDNIKDVEQSGNLGPIAGVIANFQLLEIFKYLIQKGNIHYDQFAEVDFMDGSIYWKGF